MRASEWSLSEEMSIAIRYDHVKTTVLEHFKESIIEIVDLDDVHFSESHFSIGSSAGTFESLTILINDSFD